MRTILVLNAKGGCGKTTVATNLAGYYASRDAKVTLADYDPQGSSTDWLAARPEDRPRIRGMAMWTDESQRTPAGTEYLIMDAPARTHEDMLAPLVRRAQTIVMPVLPSPMDMRAAERFLGGLLQPRQVIDAKVKLAVVANRVRDNTRAAGALEDYLNALKLPNGRKLPFLTVLRASQNYIRAAARGLSVFEFAPLATMQDREEWKPMLRWLNSASSLP